MVNPLLLIPWALNPNADAQGTGNPTAEQIFSTNKEVATVFTDAKQPWVDASTTYQATVADFQKQQIDSLNIVDSIKQLNDTTNKLIEFYGEDFLNKTMKEIIEENPDFDSLLQEEQEEIIIKKFDGMRNSPFEIIWMMLIAMRILRVLRTLFSRV